MFITEKDFSSPRWRRAFPEATLAIAGQDNTDTDHDGLVWVLTGQPGWEQLIRRQSARGRTVLALTRRPQLDELRRALTAGARGYLEAMSSTAILTQAAATTRAGGMWLPAELVNRMVGLLSPLLAQTPPAARPNGYDLSLLTNRERQVMAEVLSGASNKRIALTLNITERTVKAHLSSVFEKLGARDRMHLMLLAHGQEQS
ncbi:response regulator transcription factor [Oceanimonas pelagia]|uniref:Response regulator transcription factor n=1 Tax=Oceanimonas pelagia TaxID=3028314 RepID=A0AA50KPG9_9GAMM|nr:response regulator transcription factor [Oceanimonas pelagia]WMC11224.1 response regulator transcription factor [Oceanimonas pelagia]